jgi:hypothetical protein
MIEHRGLGRVSGETGTMAPVVQPMTDLLTASLNVSGDEEPRSWSSAAP